MLSFITAEIYSQKDYKCHIIFYLIIFGEKIAVIIVDILCYLSNLYGRRLCICTTHALVC